MPPTLCRECKAAGIEKRLKEFLHPVKQKEWFRWHTISGLEVTWRYCAFCRGFIDGFERMCGGMELPSNELELRISRSRFGGDNNVLIEFSMDAQSLDKSADGGYVTARILFGSVTDDAPVEDDSTRIDIDLVKTHLRLCEDSHSSLCQPVTSPAFDVKLIDVRTRRLVYGSTMLRYLTLSYVWGLHEQDYHGRLVEFPGTPPYSPELRWQPAVLLEWTLPTTLRDAIDLTARLGIHYLWIDALCIDQKNDETKEQEIAKMDHIYGGSVMTIIALCTESIMSGLYGVSEPRANPAMIEFEDFRVIFEEKPLSEHLTRSEWNSRGWTFQEASLSRRCLMLTCQSVYLVCQTSCLHEFSRNIVGIDDWPLSLYKILDKNHEDDEDDEDDENHELNCYESIVATYTKRTLSYQTDTLNAFTGVLNVLMHVYEDFHIHGLPSKCLGACLLWHRPRPDESSRPRFSSSTILDVAAKKRSQFPSWSWLDFEHEVAYWGPYRRKKGYDNNPPGICTGDIVCDTMFQLSDGSSQCTIGDGIAHQFRDFAKTATALRFKTLTMSFTPEIFQMRGSPDDFSLIQYYIIKEALPRSQEGMLGEGSPSSSEYDENRDWPWIALYTDEETDFEKLYTMSLDLVWTSRSAPDYALLVDADGRRRGVAVIRRGTLPISLLVCKMVTLI